ncbi:hypothetical protein QBC39DRAFT_187948 [Podospora conica]|nr:hypothetical protein QBC39DRAFT_187948 [Schizothecium conicum]
MLPHLEVGHLPSSSSFYSAVVQPLGLRYLSAEDGHFPSITFGDARAGRALFEIRQVTAGRGRPIIPSHIVISAPSAEAAEDSYTSAVRADPPPERRDSSRRRPSNSWPAPSSISATRTLAGGGRLRIRIVDFDGNTMDIVYRPPPDYPPSYGGSTLRRTQSTDKEASRILDWNYDVASSDLRTVISTDSRSGAASRRTYNGGGGADKEPYHTLRRSVTDNGSLYDPIPSPRQPSSGSGMSATTIAGALLGAAAIGGALTYGLVKSDRSHAPRQDYDSPPPPSFSRRSTFPDPYPEHQRKGGSRYVEVERAVEKVRYPDEYSTIAPGRRSPPEYVAHYSQASRRSREDAEPRGRHHESQSRSSSSRRRSEAGSYRQPLLLHDAPEHRSQVSSGARHPPIVKRSYTYELPADGWGSSASVRSQSTARPAPSPQVVSRSRSGSRMTTATIKVAGGGGGPRGVSRANTYLSARNVGLPESQAGWESDDGGSVVPSDSISNVGSRRSARGYH